MLIGIRNIQKKSISLIKVSIILIGLSLMSTSFVALLGFEWDDKQFYFSRCLYDIGLLGLFWCLMKKVVFSEYFDLKNGEYRKWINTIIAITTTLELVAILRRNWVEPSHSYTPGFLLAGSCLAIIPYTLQLFKQRPDDKRKKRSYVIMVIFGLLGAYMLFAGTLGLVL